MLSSRETVIASEAKQSVETISIQKVRVAGRPQPTLSKHGGEAEPAARTFEWILEIASLRSQRRLLAMTEIASLRSQ
jgi:hypothetical protein